MTHLLESTDAGMLFLQNGLITRVNESLAAHLGFCERELIGRHVASLFPQKNTGISLSSDPSQVLSPKEERAAHVTLIDNNGTLRPFNLMVHRVDSPLDVRCTIWILQSTETQHSAGISPQVNVPPLLIRRLQAIAENFPDLICICDPDSRVQFASPSANTILGYAEDDLVGIRALDLIHKDDRPRIVAAFQRALRIDLPPPSEPTIFRARHRDKSWRHLAVLARNLSVKGSVSGLLLSGRDVTQQHLEQQQRNEKFKRQLHYLNQLLRLVEHPPANVRQALKTILKTSAKTLAVHQCSYWKVDEDPLCTECVEAYDDVKQNFTDANPGTTLGANFHRLLLEVAQSSQPTVFGNVHQDPRATLLCEYFHISSIKALVMAPVSRSGVLVFAQRHEPRQWRKDEVSFAVHVASLITLVCKQAGLNKNEGRRHRRHGDAPALPPREPHFLLEHIENLFPQLAASSNSLAVFFIDLEGLRTINDSLGEEIGEQLLKTAALRLRNLVRSNDILARFDGDRLMLAVRDPTDIHIRDDIAQQIIESIRHPFRLEGRELELDVSVGLAFYPFDGRDIAALARKADMQRLQASPRNDGEPKLTTTAHSGKAASLPALAGELRRALAADELQHYYQPQIDLRTGKVCCVEAFLRWHHPRHGLLLPSIFLSIAEEAGLMPELSRWILNDICTQFQSWRTRGLDYFNIALNLSPHQLMDRGLVPALQETLSRTSIPGTRLEFEVKENSVTQRDAISASLLDEITESQIGLTIDDFGTGSSSLGHLRRFPVHKVKIDISFVSGLPIHDDDCAVTDAIIAMARPLGLDVVAEGVETLQQMEYLRAHGCDIAQGFYFTQPIAPHQFEKWLTRH